MADKLQPGILAELYYERVLLEKMPRQLDLMADLYPGFVIEEVPSDNKTKTVADYDEASGFIRAVRYHDRLYGGSHNRVTQILGRLTGTAKGSSEKERYTAERIRERIAGTLAVSPESLTAFRDYWLVRIGEEVENGSEEALYRLRDELDGYLDILLDAGNDSSSQEPSPSELSALTSATPLSEISSESATSSEKASQSATSSGLRTIATDNAVCDIAPEVMDAFLRMVLYQWNLGTVAGLVNVWVWLLLGALLRQQINRLLFVYLSTLEPRIPEVDDRITKEDLLEGESFYEGDDLDNRFPGILWYCDRCGERLNEQTGFDDHLPEWACRKCGYENRLSIEDIYNCEKEYLDGSDPVDKEDFFWALKERHDEVDAINQRPKT
ncbi:MAG: hypothetical protein Q4B73_08395 [Lachnospiraceae bacterium]|nr:hypothetical protein [Lachnospiraceae bacterium]